MFSDEALRPKNKNKFPKYLVNIRNAHPLEKEQVHPENDAVMLARLAHIHGPM